MNALGKIICLVGPSGVGKTSYAKRLVEKYNFTMSSVVTTRKQRADDDGRYQYVSEECFLDMINRGRLLEWDKYANYYYGTPLGIICPQDDPARPIDVILDLTPKGCLRVAEILPSATIIALLPDDPSWLFERLKSRGSQSIEEIRARTALLTSYIEEIEALKCPKVYASHSSHSWDTTQKKLEDIISNS